MPAYPAPAGPDLNRLAESRGVRECLQWFTREKQWINEIHLQLCRVPAPTFLEQERAEWMLRQLRGFGWEAGLARGDARSHIRHRDLPPAGRGDGSEGSAGEET